MPEHPCVNRLAYPAAILRFFFQPAETATRALATRLSAADRAGKCVNETKVAVKAALAALVRLDAATVDSAGSQTFRAERATSRLVVDLRRRKGFLFHIDGITLSILLNQFMKCWEYARYLGGGERVASRFRLWFWLSPKRT